MRPAASTSRPVTLDSSSPEPPRHLAGLPSSPDRASPHPRRCVAGPPAFILLHNRPPHASPPLFSSTLVRPSASASPLPLPVQNVMAPSSSSLCCPTNRVTCPRVHPALAAPALIASSCSPARHAHCLPCARAPLCAMLLGSHRRSPLASQPESTGAVAAGDLDGSQTTEPVKPLPGSPRVFFRCYVLFSFFSKKNDLVFFSDLVS